MKFIIILRGEAQTNCYSGGFSAASIPLLRMVYSGIYSEVPPVKGLGGNGDRCEHYRELMLQLGPSNR